MVTLKMGQGTSYQYPVHSIIESLQHCVPIDPLAIPNLNAMHLGQKFLAAMFN